VSYSCTPAYYKKVSGTTLPKEAALIPDYSNMNFWAAHPFKHDPADSISTGIHDAYKDSSVDVFFLHPTTFTDEKRIDDLNASLADDTLNAKPITAVSFTKPAYSMQMREYMPQGIGRPISECIFILILQKPGRHLSWPIVM
jgi:hypothetical protein